MCLIIANTTGSFVSDEHVEAAFSNNQDGFGIMYAKDGLLRLRRGLFTLPQILDIFKKFNESKQPYVAHFRYATHGTLDASNCHPFPVSMKQGGVGMVHNGTLTGTEWRQAKRSDTSILVDRIQNHIANYEFDVSELFAKHIPEVESRYGSSIGSDKLVFMNGRGNINIYNEEKGIWLGDEGEVWYSNLYSLVKEDSSILDAVNESKLFAWYNANYGTKITETDLLSADEIA